MWSAIVDVKVEDTEKTEPQLRDQVIPMVKQSPGFVAGYWMNLDDHTGTSFVVFDTEENARAAAPAEGSGPMPGVTISSVRFARVVGSA
jgi:hypothetical protein